MRRAKIAPQLSALVSLELHTRSGGLIGTKAARAELRALLAVARAAEREGRPFADNEGPACECGTCRAYARLHRVSRG